MTEIRLRLCTHRGVCVVRMMEQTGHGEVLAELVFLPRPEGTMCAALKAVSRSSVDHRDQNQGRDCEPPPCVSVDFVFGSFLIVMITRKLPFNPLPIVSARHRGTGHCDRHTRGAWPTLFAISSSSEA
eukprot:COSAG01_NODE_23_length_37704_cov_30.005877_5_plen_128_part_00